MRDMYFKDNFLGTLLSQLPCACVLGRGRFSQDNSGIVGNFLKLDMDKVNFISKIEDFLIVHIMNEDCSKVEEIRIVGLLLGRDLPTLSDEFLALTNSLLANCLKEKNSLEAMSAMADISEKTLKGFGLEMNELVSFIIISLGVSGISFKGKLIQACRKQCAEIISLYGKNNHKNGLENVTCLGGHYERLFMEYYYPYLPQEYKDKGIEFFRIDSCAKVLKDIYLEDLILLLGVEE